MSSKGEKNSHARWRILLEKHLDGELDASGRMELFEHLEECGECRETLEAEERLVDRLSRLPKLTAPSDLRAKILREAARERAETLQPLTEDDRYGELFHGFDQESDDAGPHGEPQEEFPDRGVPRPAARGDRGSRAGRPGSRSTWRRLSPRLATAFLVVSVTLTFLSRPMPRSLQAEIPGLGVKAPVGPLVQAATTLLTPQREAPIEELPAGAEGANRTLMDLEVPRLEPPVRPAHAGYGEAGARVLLSAERGLEQARSGVGRMINAITGIPLPAEQERPVAGAIVLMLDSGTTDSGSGELADLVQEVLEKRLDGQIRKYEQSGRDGERRRMFTVDLSEQGLNCLLNALQSHRSVLDDSDGKRLAEVARLQNAVGADHTSVFTASAETFTRALGEEPKLEPRAGEYNGKRVHLLLVD